MRKQLPYHTFGAIDKNLCVDPQTRLSRHYTSPTHAQSMDPEGAPMDEFLIDM